MSEAHRELAELSADLRAWLDAMGGCGVTAIPSDLRLETPPPMPAEEPQAPSPSWSSMATNARESAEDRSERGAGGLARIREDMGDCRRCPLHSQRKTIVFGVGNPEADLVIVGEAPGFHEDQQGEPFVGEAGQMLDKMLLHVLGLHREDVYILNVVKCRPPRNRNPLPLEVDACSPFLERQLQVLRPKVILLLGSVALKSLFHDSAGITRQRGVWMERNGVPTLPTFHPAYLLRNPAEKRNTFNDLKVLRTRYDALGGFRRA
jgi:uracil-DNA glycosylase